MPELLRRQESPERRARRIKCGDYSLPPNHDASAVKRYTEWLFYERRHREAADRRPDGIVEAHSA